MKCGCNIVVLCLYATGIAPGELLWNLKTGKTSQREGKGETKSWAGIRGPAAPVPRRAGLLRCAPQPSGEEPAGGAGGSRRNSSGLWRYNKFSPTLHNLRLVHLASFGPSSSRPPDFVAWIRGPNHGAPAPISPGIRSVFACIISVMLNSKLLQ